MGMKIKRSHALPRNIVSMLNDVRLIDRDHLFGASQRRKTAQHSRAASNVQDDFSLRHGSDRALVGFCANFILKEMKNAINQCTIIEEDSRLEGKLTYTQHFTVNVKTAVTVEIVGIPRLVFIMAENE